jgi:hypothetical protein
MLIQKAKFVLCSIFRRRNAVLLVCTMDACGGLAKCRGSNEYSVSRRYRSRSKCLASVRSGVLKPSVNQS